MDDPSQVSSSWCKHSQFRSLGVPEPHRSSPNVVDVVSRDIVEVALSHDIVKLPDKIQRSAPKIVTSARISEVAGKVEKYGPHSLHSRIQACCPGDISAKLLNILPNIY